VPARTEDGPWGSDLFDVYEPNQRFRGCSGVNVYTPYDSPGQINLTFSFVIVR
jgi:hypothetical protein